MIKPLLDSIALQQNVDFAEIGVIICNDGSQTLLREEFLKNYPYEIEYHLEEHGGISRTRNKCLDYSTADYVMFCDADDMFLNMCGLYILFKDMEEGFDTFVSAFVEEARALDTGEVIYRTREYDLTFVHGQVHRRQYLIDNNIRFKEELEINEDSYFTVLTQSLTSDIKHCLTPFYLWKWREGSVCRAEKWKLKTFPIMIDSNSYLAEELVHRGLEGKAMQFVAYMYFDVYYTLNKQMWLDPINAGYRAKLEKRFAEYHEMWHLFWEVLDINEKLTISNQLRDRAIKDGMEIEQFTMEEWLNSLKEIV